MEQDESSSAASESSEEEEEEEEGPAQVREEEPRVLRPQVPPKLALYGRHIREHGEGLVRQATQHAQAFVLAQAAAAAEQEEQEQAQALQQNRGDGSGGALGKAEPAPEDPEDQTAQREQAASLQDQVAELVSKLDAVLAAIPTMAAAQSPADPSKASDGARVASIGRKGEGAATSNNNNKTQEGNAKLEQQVSDQQDRIDRLLQTLEQTTQKVDLMARERELELMMVDEDSLGDINMRTMTTSLRPQDRRSAQGRENQQQQPPPKPEQQQQRPKFGPQKTKLTAGALATGDKANIHSDDLLSLDSISTTPKTDEPEKDKVTAGERRRVARGIPTALAQVATRMTLADEERSGSSSAASLRVASRRRAAAAAAKMGNVLHSALKVSASSPAVSAAREASASSDRGAISPPSSATVPGSLDKSSAADALDKETPEALDAPRQPRPRKPSVYLDLAKQGRNLFLRSTAEGESTPSPASARRLTSTPSMVMLSEAAELLSESPSALIPMEEESTGGVYQLRRQKSVYFVPEGPVTAVPSSLTTPAPQGRGLSGKSRSNLFASSGPPRFFNSKKQEQKKPAICLSTADDGSAMPLRRRSHTVSSGLDARALVEKGTAAELFLKAVDAPRGLRGHHSTEETASGTGSSVRLGTKSRSSDALRQLTRTATTPASFSRSPLDTMLARMTSGKQQGDPDAAVAEVTLTTTKTTTTTTTTTVTTSGAPGLGQTPSATAPAKGLRRKQASRLAVFKPEDEETGAELAAGLGDRNPERAGLVIGGGAKRERASYLLDKNTARFSGVPETALVMSKFPLAKQQQDKDHRRKTGQTPGEQDHEGDAAEEAESEAAATSTVAAAAAAAAARVRTKRGSLQRFCESDGNAEDRPDLVRLAPARQVHKIGILDLRIFNTDRHSGNILCKKEGDISKLIPIDHGLSLPDWHFLAEAYFDWQHWAQAQTPFDGETLRVITALDRAKDAETLRSLSFTESCIATNQICTIALQVSARNGLVLEDLGKMFQRPFCAGHNLHNKFFSPLEHMIIKACERCNTTYHPSGTRELEPMPASEPDDGGEEEEVDIDQKELEAFGNDQPPPGFYEALEQVADAQRRTVFHGIVCFGLGLAAGIPYSGVVFRDHAKEWSEAEQEAVKGLIMALSNAISGTERAWKMAHMEGLLNGLSMMIVASVLPVMRNLSLDEIKHLSTAMAVTAYGNTIAAFLCAMMSVRGFSPGGSIVNRVANLGFGAGVPAIFYEVKLASAALKALPERSFSSKLPKEHQANPEEYERRAQRTAAVCVALCNVDGEASVLLTLRSSSVGTHRGHVSFPGGHVDGDETPEEACVRELREETDLSCETLGRWHEVRAVTGTMVTPVVSLIDPDLTATQVQDCSDVSVEVERCFSLRVQDLFDPDTRQIQMIKDRFPMPRFHVPGAESNPPVWGLTAFILDGVLRDVLCAAFQVTEYPEEVKDSVHR
ncbi:Phosphatidylinositol 4-kinase gamma 6 (AtPI4Kgamma6) (PI-4Kgamma6) (PI4K gamma 6) [Durusdinium trenchii]|uniref:Phosphatidylinositol 4-kinase gamma 6 (AtPI4Kgamma6) (PI-4Kgamma6) (PI4K gamma 6) n=1 Tax=Durusdinium trenchii TaxID=1381693 RepID=A0ABP0R7S3_9DINO